MPVLTTSNVGVSFGAVDLFGGVSVSLPNDGRVGLVGPNGVGKTTLLRVLADRARPTSGAVHMARGARLGYLTQEAEQAFTEQDHTVGDEMLTVFASLRADEARLHEMEARIAEGDAGDELMARYGTAVERFELAGGYDYEARIRRVLHGLGFPDDRHDMLLEHLSGGQKSRALLARLLLERPDLLILDEPTNHLDIEAVQWLEGTLNTWDGAVIVVSHDRYFLDRVVNTVWELSPVGIEAYRGNYSAYTMQRGERWARRRTEFDAKRERLAKQLDYIKRNIAGQNTTQAKGRLRRVLRELDADGRAIKVGKAESAFKALHRPDGDRTQAVSLNLAAEKRSGRRVLRTSDLEIGFPDTPLFTADDIDLWRGECAALIGANGTGKTTFLRTILDRLEPLGGEMQLGASLKMGYFAQAHADLNPDNTVLDEFLRAHYMPTGEARNHLARFLFRGEDVAKRVRALSGGERARLALAMLALERANLLLLDEPTNHLDIPAQEVLQDVLERFDGTILMVSHDRYLIDRLATQIWAVGEGRLEVFEGRYQEYLAAKAEAAEAERADRQAARAAERAAEAETRSADRPEGLSKNEQRRRAADLERLEAEIGLAEAKLASLAADLQAAGEDGDVEEIADLGEAYEKAQGELDAKYEAWAELAGD